MKKYIEFFDRCSSYYMLVAKNDFQRLHIKRKIEHCNRVNRIAVEIGQKLNLSDEKIKLISIAALFHDIGRFKQFYKYSTYDDSISCNHALLSVEMLEEENVFEDFNEVDKRIIFEIIYFHNCKEIPSDISNELYTYVSIIRDADKIDWIYAMINIIPKLSKKNQAVFYANKEDKNFVSEKIVNLILENKVVLKSEINTIDELRLVSMGWIISGMKLRESYEIIKREDLINKTFNLISDSKEKKLVYDHIIEYVKNIKK